MAGLDFSRALKQDRAGIFSVVLKILEGAFFHTEYDPVKVLVGHVELVRECRYVLQEDPVDV